MNCKVVNFKKKRWPKQLVTEVNSKIYTLILGKDISSPVIRKWDAIYIDSESLYPVVVRNINRKMKITIASVFLPDLKGKEVIEKL